MLDYASLSALAAVVREGSFEAAAAALSITPSAVSQRIKALEESISTILLLRDKPVTATPAGEVLLRHVKALRLLEALPRFAGNDLVFPSPRGLVMSDMTLTAVMRRMGCKEVPHGFRSTFRDWAAERTNYPREVAEMALAHAIGNAVEAAYRRGDLFEKRARMMAEWARFCDTITTAGEVISIRAKEARA